MKIKLIILYEVGEINGKQTIFLSVFNVRILFPMTVPTDHDHLARTCLMKGHESLSYLKIFLNLNLLK